MQQQQQALAEEQEHITPPRFDKLWQLLDDCIITGKYKQIKNKFADDGDGRCINGVFLQYCLDQPLKDYTKGFMFLYLYEIMQKGLVKYRYSATPKYREDQIYSLPKHLNTKENLIQEMKSDFSVTGVVYDVYLVRLNNMGVSFAEIRDVLKELDV